MLILDECVMREFAAEVGTPLRTSVNQLVSRVNIQVIRAFGNAEGGQAVRDKAEEQERGEASGPKHV